MCGISGYFLFNELRREADTLVSMLRPIRHRGPDDEGVSLISRREGAVQHLVTDESIDGTGVGQRLGQTEVLAHDIGLGHRRFSIIDISPAGHQPLWSHDGRVGVAFNGEIYNYVELRGELESLGHRFRTNSDTEVLVEAYRAWGTDCFSRFNGFWALTLYDREMPDRLLLARDRIGKAPLYFTRRPEGLYWSSEIKGLFAPLGASAFTVNDQAVFEWITQRKRDLFFKTFYNEVMTLPSASFAWVKADGEMDTESYWDFPRHRKSEKEISPGEAAEELRHLLEDSVRLRMRADVPVGVELSGGMDSSSLMALSARQSDKISAFTVAFPGTAVNEEPFARMAVEPYVDRVRYNVLTPPKEDLFNKADDYVGLMHEPFHSPNMLTNYSIWRQMQSEGIRVSINGAAGDEVLGGYGNIYFIPYLRNLLSQRRYGRFCNEFLRFSEFRRSTLGYDHLKLAWTALSHRYRMQHARPARRKGGTAPPQVFRSPPGLSYKGPSRELDQLAIDELTHYEMNYWMRSGNQSFMGVPMEVRMPFLDYRVVEFGCQLPFSYLIRDGWLKWILRQAMEDVLPAGVIWRRKKFGFPFPLVDWLKSSQPRFFSMVEGLDCRYIDMAAFKDQYLGLAEADPNRLWRLMSMALWWKKWVQEEKLQ